MKKNLLKIFTLFTVLNAPLGFNYMISNLSTDEIIKVKKVSMDAINKNTNSDSENNPNSRFHHEVKM